MVRGAAFEPRLTADCRWGRLYGVAAAKPATIVFGICQSNALVLEGFRPDVCWFALGRGGGRAKGTFDSGDNGALAAFNVLVNILCPGRCHYCRVRVH